MLTFSLDYDDLPKFLELLPKSVAEEAAIGLLKSRGYHITKEDGRGWLTLKDLSLQIGAHEAYISALFNRGITPPGLEIERDVTRISRVRPGPVFYEWIKGRFKSRSGSNGCAQS